ncbi:SIMPL domain-containing protein [Robertmurraya sp. DFI.2.37]|uniref:SIMPL domain-containing protein n=1 Tax=Robertmurraya sp. DFI.2.37 TaxID=3031819 RepID=UPI001786E1CF|nr:SIMPL domain-containing protein [Robertmurraya sp. DFI.2.37]MDF1507583.1 SIMPL domain-containing protein [Robertmurraya sp. DFI.2.37]
MYHQQPYYQGTHRNLSEGEIKVIGEGIVTIQPDKGSVKLGVEIENKELMKAQTDNAKAISSIMNALQQIGVSAEHIQTDQFTIYPMYDYVDGKQIFRGYRVEHLLRITVSNLENIGLVVDTAVEHGANRVSNISFQVSNSAEVYRVALKKAVEDAVKKAYTIAKSFNLSIVPTPRKITEEKMALREPSPLYEMQMVKAASTEIEPGTTEIRSVVTAIFITN